MNKLSLILDSDLKHNCNKTINAEYAYGNNAKWLVYSEI